MLKSRFSIAIGTMISIAVAVQIAGARSSAATPLEQPTAQALLQAEDALFDADVRRDVAAIDRGFADEAIFVHVNGLTQTKADYLKAASQNPFGITQITTENRAVRIFGTVGVVHGIKRLVTSSGMHLAGSYLTIYVFRDRRWQMLDEQSSPMPPSPKP